MTVSKGTETPPVYTIENLLSRLAFTAQNEVFKKIDALIRVQGRVGKVKNYPTARYFDLNGDEGNISVKIPASYIVQTGEYLILEGMPILKTSRFHTGLTVEFEGKPIANWIPREEISSPVELKKESFVLLDDYISSKGCNQLLLIGSETGIQDVLSNTKTALAAIIPTKISNVSNKEKLLSNLREAIKDGFEALLIVRGGNDQSLDIWDDPEFVQTLNGLSARIYLALGHSHRITLACQYADERFLTPTALGTAINKILMRIQTLNEFDEKCKKLEFQNKEFDKQIYSYKQLNERTGKETNSLLVKIEEQNKILSSMSTPKVERVIIIILALICVFLFLT
jgi:hypothetical protein